MDFVVAKFYSKNHFLDCNQRMRTRLKKGLFPIKVLYFENSGDQRLELQYKGPEIKMQPIPKDALFSNKDNKLNE